MGRAEHEFLQRRQQMVNRHIYFFIIWFGDHTQQCLGLSPGSAPRDHSGDYTGCQESILGWSCARLAPCPLYYLSGTNRHILEKRVSSLIIRERYIKVTMTHPLTPMRMVCIQKFRNSKQWQGCETKNK